MPSLAEVQAAFAAAVLDHKHPPATLDGAHAAARFDIYRNAIRHNYRNALAAVYPVAQQLVGDAFFAQLCDRFVRHAPSRSGDLHDFGDALADFVAAEPALAGLPYLCDVARLEWVLHRAFHAADDVALEVAQLAQLTPDALARCRLPLRAAACLIASPYPVVRIWEVHQAHTPDAGANENHVDQPAQSAADFTVDLDAGGEQALVRRHAGRTQVERLEAAEHAMLHALHDGRRLGEAIESVSSRYPYFDLGAFLARHVPGGTFGVIRLE